MFIMKPIWHQLFFKAIADMPPKQLQLSCNWYIFYDSTLAIVLHSSLTVIKLVQF